ncbi:MAG: DUF4037 domain-containing protein [Phycisphaeraceae bacterium]|nr:DUF4037 domain-containing protein [Phycisphaeraceae bacterium]
MLTQLSGHNTEVVLSSEPWNRGLQRIVMEGREISFLLPALCGHHYFTGIWPPPADAIEYEPHVSPGSLTRLSDQSAVWHQPQTPYSHVEVRVEYKITGAGTIEARFVTTSHASAYPFGYVGLFWGTLVAPGGQRGFHTLIADDDDELRWLYFQAGGDSNAPRANTMLGPSMQSLEHSPSHPRTYFFAESDQRHVLPIQVGRWQDLYLSIEVDTYDVAFTDVLVGTALGGPAWDMYWQLEPGQTKNILCRLSVGWWQGWEAILDRYTSWSGCMDRGVKVRSIGEGAAPLLSPPKSLEASAGAGLDLSRRLFENRGKPLLTELGLLDRCSVGCFGGTSQNAGLDDQHSHDHIWGPYLTFLLREEDWQEHHQRLADAVQQMPDQVGGTHWIGYGGPEPRRTAVHEMDGFLRLLTGLENRPETDREWLPLITRQSFLGRRWTEQLFDAGQGQVFHDPAKRFTQRWRHWTGYVPPDIQRAILARSLFRVWNAGPEYNLSRTLARQDSLAFALCLSRFADEVLELAFCWNESFVPQFKWRVSHFDRLPICPVAVREGIRDLHELTDHTQAVAKARSIIQSIKELMADLYHLSIRPDEPLSTFARAMHQSITDGQVKIATGLDW